PSWPQIEDLPPDWSDLVVADSITLAETWRKAKKSMRQSQSMVAYVTRLNRAWVVETGLIDGLYALDPDTTALLVDKGLHAGLIPESATDRPVAEVIRLLADQAGVLDGLYDFVSQRGEVDAAYVKQIHHALTVNQQHIEV